MPESDRFIVKLQRSVMSNETSGPQLLVYDRDRSVWWQAPLDADPDLAARFANRLKFYAWAWLDSDRKLVIDEDAREQSW